MPLQISVQTGAPTEAQADVVAIGVWAFSTGKTKTTDEAGASPTSGKPAAKHAKAKGKDAGAGKAAAAKADRPHKVKVPAVLEEVDRALGGGVIDLVSRDDFSGKRDQLLSIPTLGRARANRVVLIGLGDRNTARDPELRAFAARAARTALADRAKSLVLALPDGAEARLRAIGEGLELGAYRFTKYLTGDRRPKSELSTVALFVGRKAGANAKRDLELGQAIAAAVNTSRDLSNEPSNAMTPANLANEAVRMAKATGGAVKTTVFDYKEIVRRGMHLIDAVGRGSANEPRLVHMAYTPQGAKKTLVFVGKGITFDSGGLSIKPAAGMGEMKHDMSGAANMVGLMQAVASLKPKIAVHAIMACAENMPDGNAYRPGDVWGSLDGKSVEIINTDAEGRLVLADALAYARALGPDLLVDNATLTGACVVALGTGCSGWYASNETTANEFSGALKASGEPMWRMPLLEELRDQLKSDVADLKHTGDRFGGSITAALFLREFIGDTKNWVHVDIAGPASADRASSWNPKGATGHGVLTFLTLVERADGRGGGGGKKK